MIKIISWNINGIYKTIPDIKQLIKKERADIYCLQETKASSIEPISTKYYQYHNPADKKGYSGTMLLSKSKPQDIQYGIEKYKDKEGRVIIAEYPKFYFICTYAPHSKDNLKRLSYKLNFNKKFLSQINKLQKKKPVIIGGDLNIAHDERDLTYPESNERSPGYTIEERSSLSKIIEDGYLDSYRLFNSEKGNYTYWGIRTNGREKNIGWRLDYFLVDSDLQSNIQNSEIHSDVFGSDHCPIELTLKNLNMELNLKE